MRRIANVGLQVRCVAMHLLSVAGLNESCGGWYRHVAQVAKTSEVLELLIYKLAYLVGCVKVDDAVPWIGLTRGVPHVVGEGPVPSFGGHTRRAAMHPSSRV